MKEKIIFYAVLCFFSMTVQAGSFWCMTDKQQNNDVFVKLHKPRLPHELPEVSFEEGWIQSLWNMQDCMPNPLHDAQVEAANRQRLH